MSRLMRVVIVTPDQVGRRMAGPGMRAHHFAEELSKHFDTTLIASWSDGFDSGSYRAAEIRSDEAADVTRSADVVIAQPSRFVLKNVRSRQRLFFDLFDPVVLELRELYGSRPTLRQRIHVTAEWWRLLRALGRGDVLITASPRQRMFYDSVCRSRGEWLQIPFGVEDAPEPSMPKDDPPSILWGGGVWAWLDPMLAIDAVSEVNRRGTRCQLVFLGGQRPGAAAPHTPFRDAVRERALANPHVRWHDEWVDYAERWAWLQRAKIAIMLHRRTTEAEYSIRTRMFDAIGAAVPVITSRGGWAADLVTDTATGIVVEPSDREAIIAAIETLLNDDVFYRAAVSGMQKTANTLRWSDVTRPLIEAVARQ